MVKKDEQIHVCMCATHNTGSSSGSVWFVSAIARIAQCCSWRICIHTDSTPVAIKFLIEPKSAESLCREDEVCNEELANRKPKKSQHTNEQSIKCLDNDAVNSSAATKRISSLIIFRVCAFAEMWWCYGLCQANKSINRALRDVR